MAPETFRCRCRISNPEPMRDLLGAYASQYSIGAAMRTARGRRLLPAHNLVLADDFAVGLRAPMAGAARARCHPEMRGGYGRGGWS